MNLKNIKIGVIMGGLSSERAISLKSGMAMYNELKKHNHKVVAIDIKERNINKILKEKIDVALLALHGTYGEDGVIQGILEFHGIPYTGSGVLGSALGMNKIIAKQLFSYNGIPTPKWCVVENINDIEKIKMKFPLVFKPNAEGSAIGVSIVNNKNDAKKAYKKAARYGNKVLVEKYIKGIEISVPVLLDKALPIIEIIPKKQFYDYTAKYTKGMSEHRIPARINGTAYKKAQYYALKAHKVLECRDYSRIDMIVRGNNVFVLEVNTLPGMTSLSLFPESARYYGISFYELLLIFINSALKRKKNAKLQI
ncbi:MAG: D-alanine--D-alanine ligase [Candidatus Goldbacteria bacterium]|nr:D-alanine--D-alanine ligase [Candidatus Goldiibacteriota bacterium]